MIPGEPQFNPFPGLRPFEMEEEYLFFGREEQRQELVGLLREQRFLTVIGSSGSGKSSLVRAGLLPALYGGVMTQAGSHWHVGVMRPGSNPLANLAGALFETDLMDNEGCEDLTELDLEATLIRSGLGLIEAARQSGLKKNENLLIVVDQFEELFRFSERGTRDEAAAFIKLLVEASRQEDLSIYVVLTMRSDFFGDCSKFEELAQAVNRGEYLVPRLNREQKKTAIEGPIKVGGGEISPRLMQRLLNDLGDDPDQLPILQHALMRTWDYWLQHRQENEPLDLRHYEAIGTMSLALSQHADEVFEQATSEEEQEASRRMFQALTEKGVDNRGIRRPTRLSELAEISGADKETLIGIIDRFRKQGCTFLMPPEEVVLEPETVIDISHESLMRVWQRLKQWVEAEAQSARIYQRLAETARMWKDGKAGLYRDPDLTIGLNWQNESKPNEAWAMRYHADYATAVEFLEQSEEAHRLEVAEAEAARQRELDQAKARAEEQTRAAGKLRRLAAGLAVLMIATGVMAYQAYQSRQEALAQRQIAQDKEKEALEKEKEALAQRQIAQDKEKEALASKKEALEQKDLADRRLYIAEMTQVGQTWEAGDVSLVRQRIDAYRHPADTARDPRGFEWGYWDRLCNTDLRTLTGHKDALTSVTFSPDGKRIASASFDGTMKLWDAATGRELQTLEGHTNIVTSVTFSPDGTRIASASGTKELFVQSSLLKDGKTVRLWDVATGKNTATLTGHRGSVMSVTFSPDGKRIASASADGTVKLWDATTGRKLHTLEGHTHFVTSVTFSPDGTRIASASFDKTVKLWDVATGQETATLAGHKKFVWGVAFSPDGATVASASWDRSVKLWDVATGQETSTLTGHKATVRSVTFSPDGARIASASEDKTIKLWDPASGHQALTLAGHKDSVWGVAFSPDGRRIASASFDKTVKLWDPASGRQTATLTGHTKQVDFVAFSPDGKRIASASWDKTVKLWDVDTGRLTATLTGHAARVKSVTFSPDGATVASASADKTIKLWDVATGQETATLTMQTEVDSVTFSPDGDRLASSSPRTVTLWDVATGRQTATLSGHTDTVFCVAFGPNGDRLASASNDQTVKLWDVATGRETATLTGHTHFVMGVAFSSDGKRIASASGDGTVKLWDVATGRETATFTEHKGSVRTVAFSPDGARVVSGGFDNTVKVWDARPWTPELKVQYETRGYLTYHTPRFSSDAALQKAIQADQTISDQVRQQALDWSELFRKHYAQQHAQQQLDRAHKRSGQLFLDSWGIVKQPELSAEQYQTALEMAAEANSLRPDHGKHMQILGIAQFRAQKYKEALATLIRCENPDDPASVDAPPYGPVFIAMTRFQLGEQEQVADLLNKIKAKADQVKEKDPQGKRLDLFIKEAESLIQNEKKEP